MFRYIYVKSKGDRLFSGGEHREIIDKYAKEGWRFVTAIPLTRGSQGIFSFDLVFEMEEFNEE
ncbi:MAG: DUF4177 domain-containing protein [Clostridium sp.]|nr:DUF4177 domain-containing protein [Clostridium sp.]